MTRYSLIFLFFLPFSLFSQDTLDCTFTGKILYKISFRPDTLSQQIDEEVSELLYNESASLFRTINNGKRDSALNAKMQAGAPDGLSLPFLLQTPTKLSFQILTSRDSIYTFDYIWNGSSKSRYKYAEPIGTLKWKLRDETKKIDGFLCQRAETQFGGRQWTAWFTQEIPLSLGPYKFSQLPGLVISVSDSTDTWNMTFLSLENQNTRIILDQYLRGPGTRIRTTKKEFFKTKKYMRDNAFMLAIAGEDSGYSTLPEKYKRKLKEEIEKGARTDNNWIELYP